jgi:hypothetical protein
LWDEDDKVTCIDLIKWANSLRGRRISVDRPAVARNAIDDEVDVVLAAEWVVAVGAVKEEEGEKGGRVFVADLGLGRGVWGGVGVVGVVGGRKRKGELGINWNGKWAVEVEGVV